MTPTTQPMRRKTRIVCISDTHNCTVNLPKGDVLIHAGDLTNQGSYSELSKAVSWLEKADFEAKIVIAGNHDITLDSEFYQEHGLYFHNKNPQDPSMCLGLLANSPSITYLCHNSATIRLQSPSGPRTQFNIFGSPYSPKWGQWAFYYDSPRNFSNSSELTSLWEAIPLETNIVITHTPPAMHCDETDEVRPKGCEALRRALWRVRPQLAVCGHIHDARGAQRVTWDLNCRNIAYHESTVTTWNDPGEGNNKISLVDLTGKKSPSLANDGCHPNPGLQVPEHINAAGCEESSRSLTPPTFTFDSDGVDAQACHSTHGLGGDPSSARCDRAALAGRLGRLETCVVNAAIMKSRHPHIGGKKFNKPIVVDLDLPVWEDQGIER